MLREGVRVKNMMGCIEVIKSKWPLAYAKCSKGSIDTYVKLLDHSELTARIIQYVFNDRIEVLKKSILRVLPLQELKELDMVEVSYIAGLIHDLGKASSYYLEKNIKEYDEVKFELSFLGHEHLISLILSRIAIDEVDTKFKLIYDLLAKIISRHHSAMVLRHPLTLWGNTSSNLITDIRYSKKGLELIRNEVKKAVLGMFNTSIINYVINDLSKLCRSNICVKIINDFIRELEDHEVRDSFSKVLSDLTRRLTSFEVIGGVSKSLRDRAELMIYKLVSTLSGFLIIADNLAAQFECRDSDDRSSKLYVEYWLKELKDRLLGLGILK